MPLAIGHTISITSDDLVEESWKCIAEKSEAQCLDVLNKWNKETFSMIYLFNVLD